MSQMLQTDVLFDPLATALATRPIEPSADESDVGFTLVRGGGDGVSVGGKVSVKVVSVQKPRGYRCPLLFLKLFVLLCLNPSKMLSSSPAATKGS